MSARNAFASGGASRLPTEPDGLDGVLGLSKRVTGVGCQACSSDARVV